MQERIRDLTSDAVFPSIAGMDKALVAALNEWRLRQSPPLEPTDAILALLWIGLLRESAQAPAKEGLHLDPRVDALTDAFRDYLVKQRT